MVPVKAYGRDRKENDAWFFPPIEECKDNYWFLLGMPEFKDAVELEHPDFEELYPLPAQPPVGGVTLLAAMGGLMMMDVDDMMTDIFELLD